jgi:hypothetical protein
VGPVSAPQKCVERWCENHVVDDYDGVVLHASRDVEVPMTAGGRSEQMVAVVVVEQDDLPGHRGEAHVRLEVRRTLGLPAGAPMTASQALELSRELERAARVALAGRTPSASGRKAADCGRTGSVRA